MVNCLPGLAISTLADVLAGVVANDVLQRAVYGVDCIGILLAG